MLWERKGQGPMRKTEYELPAGVSRTIALVTDLHEFDAPELQDKHVVIDEAYVDDRLHDIVQNHDLSQFIL